MRGFTLIELIISIAVIAVLSAVAITNLSSVQKNSRDLKRQSDLKLIQGALEQYYSDFHNYPISLSTNLVSGGRTYLNQVPTESVAGNPAYLYVSVPTSCDNASSMCTNYCLYAQVENSSNQTPSAGYTASCPLKTNYNYLVTQP